VFVAGIGYISIMATTNTHQRTGETTMNAKRLARAIARGIEATYCPENQKNELDKLAEMLNEMAMNRDMMRENDMLANCHEERVARADVELLVALADSLNYDCDGLLDPVATR